MRNDMATATIESRLAVTESGKRAGWIWMHRGGWVKSPESRYAADYTAATRDELEAAEARGEFEEELGWTKHVGGILHRWQPASFCEFCNQPYDPTEFEVKGGRSGTSGFCSDDCKRDADEEIRVADCEARREFELYGDDRDSWYR